MDFSLKQSLFAYDFMNPPAEDRTVDIDLTIVNPSNSFQLTKQDAGFQTSYELKIPEPKKIGFTTAESSQLGKDFQNLILALNLSLSRIGIITTKNEFVRVDPDLKPQDSWSTVEKHDGHTDVHLHEYIAIKDRISIQIGTSEEIDEIKWVDYFKKIQSKHRFDIDRQSTIKTINLSKALKEYENAITTFDRLDTFKNLYNTIELSTNWDGVNHEGNDLDRTISQLSGISQVITKEWRDFYNRIKHVDKHSTHVATTIQGMDNLTSYLLPIRKCAIQIIENRLNQI